MTQQENLANRLEGKCIVVTGANGYLGSALCEKLNQINCTLRAAVREGREIELPRGEASVELYQGSLLAKEFWKELLEGAEILFHFASQTSARYSDNHPEDDYAANVEPILALMEVCRENNYSLDILFSGSVSVVGLVEALPVNEEEKENPLTVYDAHKLEAENHLKAFASEGQCKTVTLRLSNVYGPGKKSSSQDRGVIHGMIRKALKGEALQIYGEGKFIRDYVFVEDVLLAFIQAATKMNEVNGEVYVIGSGEGCTLKEMIERVRDGVGKRTNIFVEVNHVPWPEALSLCEKRNFIADTKRFQMVTGWKAHTMFEDGLVKTIDYFSGVMK